MLKLWFLIKKRFKERWCKQPGQVVKAHVLVLTSSASSKTGRGLVFQRSPPPPRLPTPGTCAALRVPPPAGRRATAGSSLTAVSSAGRSAFWRISIRVRGSFSRDVSSVGNRATSPHPAPTPSTLRPPRPTATSASSRRSSSSSEIRRLIKLCSWHTSVHLLHCTNSSDFLLLFISIRTRKFYQIRCRNWPIFINELVSSRIIFLNFV
jgi:hypothetical protein